MKDGTVQDAETIGLTAPIKMAHLFVNGVRRRRQQMNPNEELDKLKKDLVDISQRVAEIQKEETRLSKLAVCFGRDSHRWKIFDVQGDYDYITGLYLQCVDCEIVYDVGNQMPSENWQSVHGGLEEEE